MTTYRIHLRGRGYSGRGVEYRIMDPDELDEIEEAVTQEIRVGGKDPKNITVFEYNRIKSSIAIPKMIVAITEPSSQDTATAKWEKTTPQQFDDSVGGLKKYFTGKDLSTLRYLFTDEHEPSKAEVDSILAGKVAVTS